MQQYYAAPQRENARFWGMRPSIRVLSGRTRASMFEMFDLTEKRKKTFDEATETRQVLPHQGGD